MTSEIEQADDDAQSDEFKRGYEACLRAVGNGRQRVVVIPPAGPNGESEQIEYGVRFLPPHRNAGESVWMPDVIYAARMVLDTPGMAELVRRQVGPWVRVTSPGRTQRE